jgi:hypothetical protein
VFTTDLEDSVYIAIRMPFEGELYHTGRKWPLNIGRRNEGPLRSGLGSTASGRLRESLEQLRASLEYH